MKMTSQRELKIVQLTTVAPSKKVFFYDEDVGTTFEVPRSFYFDHVLTKSGKVRSDAEILAIYLRKQEFAREKKRLIYDANRSLEKQKSLDRKVARDNKLFRDDASMWREPHTKLKSMRGKRFDLVLQTKETFHAGASFSTRSAVLQPSAPYASDSDENAAFDLDDIDNESVRSYDEYDAIIDEVARLDALRKKSLPLFTRLTQMLEGSLGNRKGEIDLLLNVASFIYLLYQSNDSLCVVSATKLFLSACHFDSSVSLLVSGATGLLSALALRIFREFKQMKDEELQLQSYESTVKEIGTFFSTLFRAKILTTIKEFVFSILGISYFRKMLPLKILKEYFVDIRSATIPDVIASCYEVIVSLARCADLWWEGKTWHEIFLGADPVKEAVAIIKDLSQNIEFVNTKGIPKPGYYDGVTSVERLKASIHVLETLKKKHPARFKTEGLEDVLLMGIRTRETLSIVRGEREAPFAILLHGAPGVGKSSILKLAYWCMSGVRLRENKSEYVFTRTQGSDFWDTYDPMTKPYIHFSELGSLSAELAAKAGDTSVKEFLSLIDTAEFPVNVAFKGKGEIFARPELVIADTNNPDLNLNRLMFAPAAVRRRFLYVEVTVRPEFLKADGSSLDYEKTRGYKEDYWFFNVYTRIPQDNLKSVTVDYLKRGTMTEFIAVLKYLMKQHIENQASVQAKIQDPNLWNSADTLTALTKLYVADDYCDFKSSEEAFSAFMKVCRDAGYIDDDLTPSIKFAWKIVRGESLDRTGRTDAPLKSGEFVLTEGYRKCFDNCGDLESYVKICASRGLSEEAAKFCFPILFKEYEDEVSKLWDKAFNRSEEKSDPATTFPTSMTFSRMTFPSDEKLDTVVIDSSVLQVGEEVKLEYMSHDYRRDVSNMLHGFWMTIQLFWWEMIAFIDFQNLVSHFGINGLKTIMGLLMVLMVVCTNFGARAFLLLMGVCVCTFDLKSFIDGRLAEYARNRIQNLRTEMLDNVRDFTRRAFYHPNTPYLLALSAAVGGAMLAWKTLVPRSDGSGKDALKRTHFNSGHVLGSVQEQEFQQHSVFRTESEDNETIQKIEDRLGCSKEQKVLRGALPDVWTVRQAPQSTFVQSIETLHDAIASNVSQVKIFSPTGDVEVRTHVFYVKETYCLINIHALRSFEKDFIITWNNNGLANSSCYSESRHSISDLVRIPQLQDIGMLCLSGNRKRNRVSLFCSETDLPTIDADARIEGDCITVKRGILNGPLDKPFHGYTYDWSGNANGKCGLPILCHAGKTSCIVGLHMFGSKAGLSGCEIVTRESVEALLKICSSSSGMMPLAGLSELIIPYNLSHLVDVSGDLQATPVLSKYSGSLGDSKQKSPFRYANYHNLLNFGALPCPIIMGGKSKLTRTPFDEKTIEDIVRMAAHLSSDHVFDKFGPPMMRAKNVDGQWISPEANGLVKMNANKKSLDRKILRRCISEFKERILSGLAEGGITKLDPILMEDAINGLEDDPSHRRVDASKSAGFGFSGKKGKYMPIVEENSGRVVREVDNQIKAEVRYVLSRYLEGETVGVVYSVQLKDEARSVEKVKKGKTRLFYMSPFTHLIITRMMLSKFYNLMLCFPDAFCSAIGIDMHKESDGFFHKLTSFSENITEGDFAGYDTSMPLDIIWGMSTLVYEILAALGYNDDSLNVLRCVLTEDLYPFIELNGEIILVIGLIVSGALGTAEKNTLMTVLIIMYCWYINPATRDFDFFEHNKPFAYGDDSLNAVHDKFADDFNNYVLRDLIAEHLGLEFTSARKDGTMNKFQKPSEMSFLKRTFRYNQVTGRVQAVLDPSSLVKTLVWLLPSSSVNETEQLMGAINSVLMELYLYQDSVSDCERIREALIGEFCRVYSLSPFEVNNSFVVPRVFYSKIAPLEFQCWENRTVPELEQLPHDVLGLVDQFTEDWSMYASPGIPWAPLDDENFDFSLHSDSAGLGRITQEQNDMSHHSVDIDRSSESCDSKEWSAELRFIRTGISSLQRDLQELKAPENPCPNMTTSQFMSHVLWGNGDQKYQEYYAYLCRRESLISSIQWLREQEDNYRLHFQSDVVTETFMEDVKSEDHEQIFDADDMGETDDFDLNSFLRRPIPIFSDTLVNGVHYLNTFNVMSLLLSQQTIRAKLAKFSFMRALLKLRIEVSGTPFNYGMLQIAAIPWAITNNLGNFIVTGETVANRSLMDRIISTVKGVKYIDVQENVPLEMSLPYISPQPWGRLYNEDNLALNANYDDFLQMWNVVIRTITTTQSVSTTPTDINFVVYAWLEDVKLTTPTATKIQLNLQSDERRRGPVETMTSKMLPMFKSLYKIPYIGKFAEAATIVTKGVGQVATLFGFSRPTLFESKPTLVKARPLENGAVSIGADYAHKLAFDPQQSTTIDPSACGSSEDEMSFKHITSREGLVDIIDWTSSDLVGTSLAIIPVSPVVYYGPNGTAAFTPMGYLARIFEWWNGSITYRIRVVCSKYHRGKIAVKFEPNSFQFTLIEAAFVLNQNCIYVLDLSEGNEFEITVPWVRNSMWLHTGQMSPDIGEKTITYPQNCNGYLSFFPLTKLQSPVDLPIKIQVFARSDDMRFQVHAKKCPKLGTETIPAGLVADKVIELNKESKFELQSEVVKSNLDLSPASVIMFGEEVFSIRTMLKRFISSLSFNVPAGMNGLRIDAQFPFVYETDWSFRADIPNTGGFLYDSYLRSLYLGMRGSNKWRLLSQDVTGQQNMSYVKSYLEPGLANTYNSPIAYLGRRVGVAANNVGTDSGCTTFIPNTDGGYEVDVPLFNNNMWIVAAHKEYLPQHKPFDYSSLRQFRFEWYNGDASNFTLLDHAYGDDFAMFYFLAVPPMGLQ